MIRQRQHWIVLVRPGPVIMTALGLILARAALSPGTVIRLLHVTSDSPGPVLGILYHLPVRLTLREIPKPAQI
jgi:hypothetical protein